MKETILKRYTILGIIFVLITGTVSHFVYQWSDNNFILGFFFPVNESVWEHFKLTFFPMLLYSFYMDKKVKPVAPCVTSALLFGTISSTLLLAIFFYAYFKVLGRSFLAVDILIFIVSVLLGFKAVYRFSISCELLPYAFLLKAFLIVLAACLFIFTYHPLPLEIFRVPAG